MLVSNDSATLVAQSATEPSWCRGQVSIAKFFLFCTIVVPASGAAVVDPSLILSTTEFLAATEQLLNNTGMEPMPIERSGDTTRLTPIWQVTPSISFHEDVAGRWHSKGQQDQLVFALLSGKRSGYFVDLAANHPVFISNTRALERDYDWRGICIEANPRYWALLRAVRRCNVVGVAVTSVEQTLTFINPKKGGFGHADGLKSADGKVLHRKITSENASTSINLGAFDTPSFHAKSIPFGNVLADLSAPLAIDYLSLDVEGAEPYVLESFPFSKHVVSLMTIETVTAAMTSRLASHNYRLLCHLHGDEVWAHQSAVLDSAAVQKMVECGRAGMRCEPLLKNAKVNTKAPNSTRSEAWTCENLWYGKAIQLYTGKSLSKPAKGSG